MGRKVGRTSLRGCARMRRLSHAATTPLVLVERRTGGAGDRHEGQTMETTIEHWVGGRRLADQAGRWAPVFNPASGQQQARVALASAAEVDEAVQVAAAAFLD